MHWQAGALLLGIAARGVGGAPLPPVQDVEEELKVSPGKQPQPEAEASVSALADTQGAAPAAPVPTLASKAPGATAA